MSDRLVRFAGDSWQEIEALPQSVRWTDVGTGSSSRWKTAAESGQEIISIQLVRLDT